MINRNITNFHVEYMDVIQHWCPNSEKYAGADSLLTMMYEGWEMKDTVIREEHWFAGMRLVNVYRVELERDSETMTMQILHNPYIARMIANHDVEVITTNPN